MKKAFTLVELLVVVTIIVILLALLIPAMDKAIYQAELVQCAAKHRALAQTAITYAHEHSRHYPWRPQVDEQATWPQNITMEQDHYDLRPRLRPYMPINGVFNCPLFIETDKDSPGSSSFIQAGYNFWFGWRFRNGNRRFDAMRKLGDRWTWENPNIPTVRSNLISATRYHVENHGATVHSTHPGDTYSLVVVESDSVTDDAVTNPTMGIGPDGKEVRGFWVSTTKDRGPVDLNAAFDDLSVARIAGADWDLAKEDRLVSVPTRSTPNGWPNPQELVPRGQ